MRILVTGGCGYVGTVLTEALLNAGHDIVVYDIMWFGNHLPEHDCLTVIQGDIRDIDQVPMEDTDTIIHLANVANDPCAELDSKLSWEINVLATMGLVEKAINHGVKQFIYASSGSVYGVKDEPEVTEELSLVPISDYNKTKMVAERVLLSYADRVLVQIVRPATVCGYSPRMRLDLSVNMLTTQALMNGRITVFGGDQTRPNIHVRDLTGVYLHMLDRGAKLHGVYNAGFENLSIMEIAKRAAAVAPAEVVVSESNDPRSYRLSSRRLLATGFRPQHTVADAMREIAEAHKDGRIKDDDVCYNIRAMKKLHLA